MALQLIDVSPSAAVRPIPSALRLSLRVSGAGWILVCQSAPDPDGTASGWAWLVEDPTSHARVERLDQHGHLIDARTVSVISARRVFGQEVPSQIC